MNGEIRGLFGNKWDTGLKHTFKKATIFIFGRYVAKHISLWNASYLMSRTDMIVVRYTETAQAIGTRSTPAPLAQRHTDETYTGTRSKMYKGCTNMVYII